jgi:hypothetical protein
MACYSHRSTTQLLVYDKATELQDQFQMFQEQQHCCDLDAQVLSFTKTWTAQSPCCLLLPPWDA